MILISHLHALFSAITLYFFSPLTLLRLSMTRSKSSLGKSHIALENMWVIFFKFLVILISNIIPQWSENRYSYDFNTIRPWNFCTLFNVPGYVPMSPGLQCMGTWIEFVSCYCVKIVYIFTMLNWFMVLSRSIIAFYSSIYAFY